MLARTLLLTCLATIASVAHAGYLPTMPVEGDHTCGGRAPDVVQCGTGYHVYVIDVTQGILVDEVFTGGASSTLTWGAPGNEAKQTLSCTVVAGRGPCRTTTSVDPSLAPLGKPPYPGIPFRHSCLVSQGSVGVWVCEVEHR